MPAAAPQLVILAGPNGAGKTTIAREVLHKTLGITEFVNADTLAAGLSGEGFKSTTYNDRVFNLLKEAGRGDEEDPANDR